MTLIDVTNSTTFSVLKDKVPKNKNVIFFFQCATSFIIKTKFPVTGSTVKIHGVRSDHNLQHIQPGYPRFWSGFEMDSDKGIQK